MPTQTSPKFDVNNEQVLRRLLFTYQLPRVLAFKINNTPKPNLIITLLSDTELTLSLITIYNHLNYCFSRR